jgi:CO dehydrogenase maturation factor
MGRPESLGCYCPVNDILRSGIETLSEHFDTIIIDGEAGVEQINRQVMRGVDIPIIVSDISSRGLQTASLIKKVIESHNQIINFTKMGLVLNRVRGIEDQLEEYVAPTGLDLFGFVPEDENITLFDMQARPLLEIPDDSPAFMAVEKVLERLSY